MSDSKNSLSFKDLLEQCKDWMHDKVDKEALKAGNITKPEVSQIANEMFKTLPLHQCYWNDRFVIAVMLNLPWDVQQKTAWCAINNGLTGYWERTTHFGCATLDALVKIGIDPSSVISVGGANYCTMKQSIAAQIAEYFELPSKSLRPSFQPDSQTESLIRTLWGDYSHSRYTYQLERY